MAAHKVGGPGMALFVPDRLSHRPRVDRFPFLLVLFEKRFISIVAEIEEDVVSYSLD